MKRKTFIKTAMFAAFAGFIFCLGAQTARAQNVQPFVECVEPAPESGKLIAYFGYINYGATTAYIPLNTAGNVTSPVRNPPGQPEYFLPGINHRVFSVKFDVGTSQIWRLSTYYIAASYRNNGSLCSGESANARLMTYQGKLSDGGAAANGVYDLQFQLFNAATDGEARTTKITMEDVTVANGIFTVQLDLGANSLVNASNINQPYNPSILNGENGFFEIGVRPGNSTDDFTVLTPRQPLTAVPMAMRSNTANNALRAAIADTGSDNFEVRGNSFIRTYVPNNSSVGGGNLTVEKNLTVNGTIYGTVTNAANAANATNAVNADNLGGVAANQFIQTNDSRLSDARTPTAGSGNYIQNTTTPQADSNFNVSGSGTIGGNLTVGGTLNASLGQSAATVYGTGSLTVTRTNQNFVLVPGLTQTIDVPANAALLISTDGGIQTLSETGDGVSIVEVAIFVDGAIMSLREYNINNAATTRTRGTWDLSGARTLAAGNHTVEIRTRSSSESFLSNAIVSSGGDATSEMRGQLTVTIIKK